MIKKITALILCLALCISVCGVFAADDDGVTVIETTLDNAEEHSPGVKYDSVNSVYYDDYVKAVKYVNQEKTPAYIVYKSETPFKSFGIEFYMYRWNRADMKYYVSNDGKDWKFADIQMYSLSKLKHNDVWDATQYFRYITKGEHLDGGYNYIKIEFPTVIDTVAVVKAHFCENDVYDISTDGRVSHYQKPDFDYSTIVSLKDAFKDYFDIGVSVEPWDLEQYSELLSSQFNVITTENQFKGHVFQQGPDQWYYDGTDQIVNWALEHGMEARGHALWYHGNHYWAFFKDDKGNPVSKEEALKRMEKHVKAKVSRYKGKMKYYDVVNEIFDPGSGTLKSYMEEAQICGQDYVPLLFKWAREADPDAVLIINDNSHLIPAMRKGIIKQVKEWLDQGVPIDAIGLQWHESVFSDPAEMRDLFKQLRELGLPVYITEMDMTAYHMYDPTTVYKWEDREKVKDAVARAYATTFDIFRENADIIECVSFWCPTDNRSSVTRGNRYDYPLPFDMNGKPSLNYYAIIDEEGKMPRMTEDVWDWPELAKNYPEGYEPTIAPVYKGTPVVDGKIDDIWSIAEEMPVEKFCVGKEGATGTVKVLWDDDYLYVLGRSYDSTPDCSGGGGWNRDNMEIFVSQSNMHVSWMGGGDVQYRIDPSGEMQSFDQAVCVPADDGYLYEARILLDTVKPAPGTLYSFEAGFADAQDGVVTSISKWCDVTNNSYQATELWGDIIISDGTTPVPQRGNTVKNEDKTPQTGNYVKDSFNYKGEQKNIPIISENGCSMIGMKDFLTLTGTAVKTDKDGKITLYSGENTVELAMGSGTAYVNGSPFDLPCAPVVIDGKTRLPLRFVFEGLGYNVLWDEAASAISVN